MNSLDFRPTSEDLKEALLWGVKQKVPLGHFIPDLHNGDAYWGITIKGGTWMRNDRLRALFHHLERTNGKGDLE